MRETDGATANIELPHTENLVIAYDGPALNDGSIEIGLLVPALQGLATLLGTVNTSLNNESANMNIKVRAFSRGSFQTEFHLAQNILSPLLPLFVSHGITDLKQILKLIGLAKDAGASALALLRFLNGKKPTISQSGDGTVNVTVGEHSKNVSVTVLNIVNDPIARKGISDLVAPLMHEGINALEVRENGKQVLHIDSSELSAFRYDRDLPEEKEVIEKRVKVQVSKPDLDGGKWFVKSGRDKFWASIVDPDFTKKVHMGEIAFAAGGTLDVDLAIYRTITSEKTSDKHEITKVHKYTAAPRQLPLNMAKGSARAKRPSARKPKK